MRERQDYADGTYLTVGYPWGLYSLPGRVLCSDGKVRALARISETADTFFSVPAAVKVKGRTVSGYVTMETRDGFSTATEEDPVVVKFVAFSYGRNGHLLPGLTYRPASSPMARDAVTS